MAALRYDADITPQRFAVAAASLITGLAGEPDGIQRLLRRAGWGRRRPRAT
jgi:hypothetical protein